MTRRHLLRKAVRIAGYVLAGLVVLAVVIAVGAPIYFRGERFGRLVESALPETRGHTHVGGGDWSWGAVIALLRGQPAALALDDLTITDPEAIEVLHIDHLSARIEVHRKPTRIIIHDLEIKDARWRFARMAKENKVGFLAAFEGVKKAARKPSKPPTSTELSIAGARLEGIEATFDLPTWGLNLRDVHAIGALDFKGKTFTFEVKDADVRGGGRLRILGPKNGFVLPLERGRLQRVATTAEDPDNIHLEASGVVTGRSRTSGAGVFTGIYGISPASKHQGIDFDAHIENAADAVNAIVTNRWLGRTVRVGGDAADLRVHFGQPFDAIAIDARARGFDVAGHDFEARDLGFHLETEPQAGRFRVERLTVASPEGGRLEADATVDRLRIDATVTCKRFAARTLLPSPLRGFAGKALDGTLHARADLLAGDAELVRSTLVLTRGDGEKGPTAVALLAGAGARAPPGATVVRLGGAKLADGVLRVPRIALGMWGGTFAAEGRVALWDPDERQWLSPPRLDLRLQANGILIERLIGSGFARGPISFNAHAHGTTESLTLEVDFTGPRVITVLGEKVRLPTAAKLRLDGSTIDLGNLPLGGPGESAFITSGRIGLSGRLALDVGVFRFPIERLPGISGTTLPVGGSISGAVRIVGEPRAPALSGQFTLAGVTVANTSLGGGTIEIAPERHGAVRARGHLTDAIAIDGRLAPKASGLEGEVTLTLTRLTLDPFLPALPGLKPGGFISGTGSARIEPGKPATAEAKLHELALSLASTDARGKPATIDVRAENEIVLRVRGGDGLSLSPARFRMGTGWIELAGESHHDQQRATLRGHLELAAAAPFAHAWFKELAGSLEVDLSATAGGDVKDVAVTGNVTVATPVSVTLAALPLQASIPGGRLSVTRNVVDTAALPIVLHAERFPVAAVSKIDAKARLTGRIDAMNPRARFSAHVALDNLDIHVPLVGRKPVHAAGGVVDVVGDAATGKVDLARIDLPISAEAEALAAAAGVTVDRAKVALRVRGTSRQLALSGDVDLASAHIRADALKGSSSSGGGGGGGKKKGLFADHPEIEAMALDVRVRSGGGAVHVDVNNLPDLRVDVDMHVGGTVKKPSFTGTQKGANVWSSFVLALVRLFS
jgi:hypothetical protein